MNQIIQGGSLVPFFMRTILIICYSPLHRDPRVLRQIRSLNKKFRIFTAGLSNPSVPVANHVQLSLYHRNKIQKLLKLFYILLGKYDKVYWNQIRLRELQNLSRLDFHLIIANDIDSLPIAYKLTQIKCAKLIFDAHEFYPDFGQKNLISLINRKVILDICHNYLGKVGCMFVVSKGIQKEYRKKFGIESFIIRNSTDYHNLDTSDVKHKISLVHHGLAHPARKLEILVDLMEYLNPRFELHFYLVVKEQYERYFHFLKEKAFKYRSRIFFHQPVNTSEIPEELNKYDLGIFILPWTSTNYKYALPNKFFEFIQARLGVIIGPSPDMKTYVEEYGLGVVSKSYDVTHISMLLNKLSISEIKKFKNNSDKFAKDLSFQNDEKLLIRKVKELLN